MEIKNIEKSLSKSGKCKSLVIFLHGYGANGADLIGLSKPLAEHFPDTTFISPDAFKSVRAIPLVFSGLPVT